MTKDSTEVHIPFAKRTIDIIVSGILLIILSPLFLVIILCLKIEGFLATKNRGPILYKETRMSQGKPFKLRKFRIFKVAAYESIRNNGDVVHTKRLEKNPKNLTKCGKILMAFYLDEAPQLWNVFVGDMSMVGPRPWNPVDYKNEIGLGILRKKVIKAGLTGPVQIRKLNANKYGGEHKLDGDYIELNRNKNGLLVVAHDIKILFKSLWFMLKGQGL
jgi:O-antigen biosynthesis protein WbqP